MPRSSQTITAAPHLSPAPANLHVGTSGWAYPTWKPGFYPKSVPARAFLHFYASVLTAVEVNYTFRALPTETQLHNWLSATPEGFQFSFKAPQRITHFSRLRDCEAEVDRFLTALQPVQQANRLGPVLFQLPPNFAADLSRLEGFLSCPALRAPHAPRIAFEFRHASWFSDPIYAALRDAGAALCIADTDDLTTPDITTAAFHCFRLRRDGGYTAAELATLAQRFTSLAAEAPTYVFFRHQDEPTGALNGLALLREANALAEVSSTAQGLPS